LYSIKIRLKCRSSTAYWGAEKSLARPGRKQARTHVRDARNFDDVKTRAVTKFFFSPPPRGEVPKEIHAILKHWLVSVLAGLRTYQHPCTMLVYDPVFWLKCRSSTAYWGAEKSLARPGRKQARTHVRDARDFDDVKTLAVSKFPPPLPPRGEVPKEIHAILKHWLVSVPAGLRTYQHPCTMLVYDPVFWLVTQMLNIQKKTNQLEHCERWAQHSQTSLTVILPTQHKTSYLLVFCSVRHNRTDKSVRWYIFQYMPLKICHN